MKWFSLIIKPKDKASFIIGMVWSCNATGSSSTNAANNLEPVKDKKVIQWMLTLHQIGLDVIRTDRTLVFYENPDNLSKLWDILAVYAWIDIDVGYCQGMSDLCSPMIILLDNEADSFWCFERLMRRLRGNFRCTDSSVGVETQLSNLAAITQVVDPKLHQHLVVILVGSKLDSNSDHRSEIPLSMVTNRSTNDKQGVNAKVLLHDYEEEVDESKLVSEVSNAQKALGNDNKGGSEAENKAEDNDSNNDEDDDNDDDELRKRVEEFIEMVNKGWKAEMLRS